MVRIQVQLTQAQAQAIRRLPADREVPMAQIIRQSIDEYLGGLHRPDEQELRRPALSIIDRELRRFIVAMPAQAGP